MRYISRKYPHYPAFAAVAAFTLLATANGLASDTLTQSSRLLPLSFVRQNDGFVARGEGYRIALSKSGPSVSTFSGAPADEGRVSVQFVGASHTTPTPEIPLPGKINYISGNDPSKWKTGLSTWQHVHYFDAYPGIDIVYYGSQRQLEFDLVLKPGADPRRIRMAISGASRLSIDEHGALQLGAGRPAIELPGIYQIVDGRKKEVKGRFVIKGKNVAGVELGAYDRKHSLVIDPTIVYSALLSGGGGSTTANALAVDGSGNMIVAGSTPGYDFPTVNAAQSVPGSSQNDAFISKINAAGDTLLYSTYLGGDSVDTAYGVAVDAAGSVWVTGSTRSSNFPLLSPQSSTANFNGVAFVARLSGSGSLQFSTYLGAINGATGRSIAVDSSGNGYVTGETGLSFPTSPGALSAGGAFVVKYRPNGVIVYSALLGGDGRDFGRGIAVDAAGNAYVTGTSSSTLFSAAPPGGAVPSRATGTNQYDTFVAKVNSTGNQLLYFTFLGSSSSLTVGGIAIDASGTAWIAGSTRTPGLATPGVAQTTLAGGADGFVAQLNAAGSAINWFTYLGGRTFDSILGIALDGAGNAYVTGVTNSNDFPAAQAVQPALGGSGVSILRSPDSGVSWSVYDGHLPGSATHLSLNASAASALAFTSEGIYRTVDSGVSWSQQSTVGANGINFSSLLRIPSDPNTVYAFSGSQIVVSKDDGVTWNFAGFVSAQAGLVDPVNPSVLYAYGSSGATPLLKTTNGLNWFKLGAGLPFGQIRTMVATSDGTLYAGISFGGIFRSVDQGANWTSANGGLPAVVGFIAYGALAASGNTVYFAGDQLYKLTAPGSNWMATGNVIPAPILVSPQNGAVLYSLSTDNALRVSTDSGATWSSGPTIPADLTYSSTKLIADPADSGVVFVLASVNANAFVTKLNVSGSLVWSTFLGGPGASSGNAAALNASGDVLVAGTTTAGFPITTTALPSAVEAGSLPTLTFITQIAGATASCSLQLRQGDQVIPPSGGALVFSVVAPEGCDWTASTDQSWAVLAEGKSVSGTGSVVVRAAANTGGNRTAILTIGSKTVSITQADAACSYSVDQSSYVIPSAGADVSIVLTTGANCPWKVAYPSPTVTLISSASGVGSATISVHVASNPATVGRTYTVYIGSATAVLSQGIGTPPVVSGSPYPSPGTAGALYPATTFSATGGSPPYGNWTVSSGSLPPGISLEPATGTISGTLASSAVGSYSFSLTVRDANNNTSNPLGFSFQVNPGTAITGISSAADLSAPPLAPGSLAQLTGTLLATSTTTAGAGAAPFTLGGATVSVNGAPAAILSASPAKIVFQVPYETAVGNANVIVTASGSTSGPLQFAVVPAAPAIISIPNNSASAPVNPGASATVYYTGAGLQTPAIANGAVGPSSAIPSPVLPATATFAGTAVPVTSQTLVPGLVGYSQLAFQIPTGTLAGAYPIVITANGRSSLAQNIYVQGVAPSVTSLAPASGPVGGAAVTIGISGSSFGSGATVSWTAPGGQVTSIVPAQIQATNITVVIPASLFISAGIAQVAVVNALGGASGAVAFHIVPVITSVTPTHVVAGGGDTVVTVLGLGLSAGAAISFTPAGGTAQTIALSSVQATQVSATIPAADLTTVGTAQLAVGDGTGGLSNTLPLSVTALPTSAAVALTSSAATSIYGQAASFTATVTPASAAGKVTFYAGTSVIGTATLSGGTAVFTTIMLPPGSQSFKARYSGDDSYAPAVSAALTHKIITLPSNGWAAPVGYGANPSNNCIATGDFDGDGRQDLIACTQNYPSNDLDILKGNGDGTFQAPVAIGLNVQLSLVLVADFNGDGASDLAACAPQGIYILLGKGDGTFQAPVLRTTTAAAGVTTTSVTTADLDFDGIPDLVASNADGSMVSLLGIGDGSFRTFATFGTTFSYGNRIVFAPGDFNGDGKPDLAVPDITTSGFRVFLGKGDGTFQTPIVQSSGNYVSSYYLAITAGDLNSDGVTDLIMIDDFGLRTALGKGDGTFAARAGQATGTPFPALAALTDYNGDGVIDLIVNGSYSYSIMTGDSAGNYSTSATYPWGGSWVHGPFVLGSFDGKGRVEAADIGHLSVWLDAQSAAPIAVSIAPATAEVGDAATTMTLTGINIGLGTTVLWTAPDGSQTSLTPAELQQSQITPGAIVFTVPATSFAKPGIAHVKLVNNFGMVSNALAFTITPFTITSVASGTVHAGASHAMITVTGPTASHSIGLLFIPPGGTPKTIGVTVSAPNLISATIPGQYLTLAGTAQVALIKNAGVISNSLSLSIGQALQVPVVALSSSATPSMLGPPVTFTASLTPASATGKVFFYDGVALVGGGPVVNGAASVTSILLTPGSHSIVARYTGDDTLAAASSNPFTQAVSSVSSTGFGAAGGFAPLGNAQAVAAGDFNADGNADFAIANAGKPVLTILLGNGDGTFRSPATYGSASGSAAYRQSLAVGDLNGDGLPDIAVADSGGNQTSVFMGKGDGTFLPAVQYANPSGASPSSILIGDFDRDAIPDLLTLSFNGFTLWSGTGDGSFRQPVEVILNSQLSYPATADFNNDGNTDFLIFSYSNSGYTGILEMLGNGDGTFQQSALFSPDTGGVRLVTDFNGDGISDLVVSGKVAIGNGNGTFGIPASVLGLPVNSSPFLAADLNGDGYVDLLTGGFSISSAVFFGTSDGSRGLSQQVPNISIDVGAAVADFNGDGRPDLGTGSGVLLGIDDPRPMITSVSPSSAAAASGAITIVIEGSNFSTGARIQFFRNGSVTSIIPTQLQPGQITATIPASLLSQAGTVQLSVAGGLQSNSLPFYITPFRITSVTPGIITARSQAVAVTITGQGLTTAVSAVVTAAGGAATTVPLSAIQGAQVTTAIPAILIRNAGALQIALSDSAGNLSNPLSLVVTAPLTVASISLSTSATPTVLGQPVSLTATVSPASATGKVTFYSGISVIGTRALSGGTATLVTRLLPTGGQQLRAHYSGDATNGPGDAAPVSQTVNSNASAGLRSPVVYGSGVNAGDLATGDFNNDGIADIANATGTALTILIGDGAGGFVQTASYSVAGSAGGTVRVADFNGDGNADIAIARGGIFIFVGNGDGTFQPPTIPNVVIPIPSTYISSFAVADIDGDGVADVIGGRSDGAAVILVGNGDGTFTSISTFGTVPSASGSLPILAFDFDGDGKVDISYVGAGNVLRIFPGNGDGTFRAPLAGPVIAAWQISADFNGDGTADLATTALQSWPYYGGVVALGDAAGAFAIQPVPASAILGLSSRNAVAADFTGDGKPDLVIADSYLRTLRGKGDGTFDRQTLNPGFDVGFGLVVADFNGDGVADLATGLTTAGIAVLLGEPGAQPVITGIAPSYTLASLSAAPVTITISGQNLGRTASVYPYGNTIVPSQVQNTQVTATIPGSVLHYRGSLLLSLTSDVGVPSNTLPFQLVDFAISAVTPNSAPAGSQSVQIVITGADMAVRQNEKLVFRLPDGTTQTVPLTNLEATQAAATIPAAWLVAPGSAELWLDGDRTSNSLPFTIALAAPPSSLTISSSLNPAVQSRAITLSAHVYPATAAGTVIFYDGLTAVGRATVAAGEANITTSLLAGGKRYITAHYLGDSQNAPAVSPVFNQIVAAVPSRGFLPAANYITGYLATGVTMADLNRDGTPDLVLTNSPGSVSVLTGKGDGDFRAAVTYSMYGSSKTPLAADFDGDGKTDVASPLLGSYGMNVLKGNGDGTLQGAVFIGAGSTGVSSSGPGGAVADLNGDGVPDMIAPYEDHLSARLGLGDGTFAPQIATSGNGGVVAAGDFNGDGKADFISGETSGFLRIFRGNGDGTFQASVVVGSGSSGNAQSIAAGDFNNDGVLDFTFADGTGLWMALGHGNAEFTLSPVSGAGNSPEAVTACDFDGDGRLDLCIADGSSANGGAIVLRGIGDGTFHNPVLLGTGIPAIGIVAADFNGDGQTDLALINQGSFSVSVLLALPGTEPQQITFGVLNDVAVGSGPIVLSASAGSGLPISYVSNLSAVCTVSGNTVTILSSGGCSITASQAGNADYAPALPVTRTFAVLFSDTAPTDYYYAAITAMAQHGITAGCGNNNYCPQRNVTRDQMAIFIVRAIYGSDNFTYETTPYFTDVQPATFGFKWIQKLRDLGITSGCTATTYCPALEVTRDQMAIFIIRARLGVHIAGANPSFSYSSTPLFTDAPTSGFAFPWIQRMKQEHITSGCTAETYCPSLPVSRGDMAIFIMRGAFNQALPPGTPLLTALSPSAVSPGTSGTFTITGANTSFVQGTTQVHPMPGIVVGEITVNSATSMTVQLTVADDAVTRPYSLLVTTGSEEAVLPNGLVVR